MKKDKNKQLQKAEKKETSIARSSTDREILQDAGRVTAEIAKAHAESEFENTASFRIGSLRVISTDC
jgi:hypothetical protein